MTHRHDHGCGPRGRVEFNWPEALFAMRGVRKTFGATVALDGVDLSVAPGEICWCC